MTEERNITVRRARGETGNRLVLEAKSASGQNVLYQLWRELLPDVETYAGGQGGPRIRYLAITIPDL